MKLNIQWEKVLYGIILIVIGIILAALHFIVAEDGIRDFISSIIAVISVLGILVGTYIIFSEIRNCKWYILKYCECSAGWYMRLFSEVFEKSVTITIVDTIVNGGASECVFEISDYV